MPVPRAIEAKLPRPMELTPIESTPIVPPSVDTSLTPQVDISLIPQVSPSLEVDASNTTDPSQEVSNYDATHLFVWSCPNDCQFYI